jgi:hypothetical protein
VEPDSVTVLGREFHVSDTYGLEAGAKVAVHGELQSDGTVSNAWVEPVGEYTPGADQVFETGVVTSVDESLGEMTLSGTNIDYTPSLSEVGANAPSVGQTVAVVGTQPVAGGTVLVSTTNATYSAAAMVANSPSGMRVAVASSGRVRSYAQSGGGARSQAQSGGGLGSQAQSGGGYGSLAQSGGGLQSFAQSGGGLGSQAQSGGGYGSLAQSGGGLKALAQSGGGSQ